MMKTSDNSKSNKVTLTVPRIENFWCEEGKPQAFLWCNKVAGLGVKNKPKSAHKSFILQTRIDNKPVRITIGNVKAWSIKGAQEEAQRLQVEIDRGNDPRKQAKERKAKEQAEELARIEAEAKQLEKERREAVTFGVAWEHYLDDNRKDWSEWSIRDNEGIVSAGGKPKKRGKGLTEPQPLAPLLDVRLVEFTPTLISGWLAGEVEKRPTRAALAYRLLSAFVNWCDHFDEYKELIPENVMRSKKVKDLLPKSSDRRDDTLQREQLAVWFKAVRQINNPVISAYLQTLVLTGARRREIAELTWNNVDFKWSSMTIRDKVEGERTIPLTPYLAYLFQSLPKRNKWVFSSLTSGSSHIEDVGGAHRKALKMAGLPDVTVQGLRRTFTNLTDWVQMPDRLSAQIQGQKPKDARGRNYKKSPLDLLRLWHVKYEKWVLNEAGVDFDQNVNNVLRVIANESTK